MSRIGKLPIKIPENVTITYNSPEILIIGPFGTLKNQIPESIRLEQKKHILIIQTTKDTRKFRALHGLYRTLINNMIIGVSRQFEIILNLQGVGYKGILKDKFLILNLGYSHTVNMVIPDNISVKISQNTLLTLKGCDKEKLGLFAANIRSWRLPEPYKGKGILYNNEIIKRKAGKSGKK